MHTHSNKKIILYFFIILLIFLFNLNGNKIYTIKYDDLESKNSQILKSENINNYILDDKKNKSKKHAKSIFILLPFEMFYGRIG